MKRNSPAAPRTVARYLTHLAGLGRSVATIDRRDAVISLGHREADLDTSTATEEVRAVLPGLRNALGRRAAQKALMVDLMVKVVREIPSDLVGL